MLSVRVEDDGPGFADIAEAWTLMESTPKGENPSQRGRFNLGEKELVSVAAEALIETAGHTVHFHRMGGRVVTPNERQQGTVITAMMPWLKGQAGEMMRSLKRFRPNGCAIVVNGETVPEREPEPVRAATLATVIYGKETGTLRPSRRRAEIHLLPLAGEECCLYEMGIPIQPIAAQWDIYVRQKVPVLPNRDTVPESYLVDIYAEALNAAHRVMEADEFGEQWVKTAMEYPRVESEAAKSVMKGRYEGKALMASSVGDSNMQAAEEGYKLVNPRSLSATEKERFQKDARLKISHDVFGHRLHFYEPESGHPVQHGSSPAAGRFLPAAFRQEGTTGTADSRTGPCSGQEAGPRPGVGRRGGQSRSHDCSRRNRQSDRKQMMNMTYRPFALKPEAGIQYYRYRRDRSIHKALC